MSTASRQIIVMSSLLFPALAAVAASGDLEREFDIGPGGALELNADAGYIRVDTWSEPRIRVVVEGADNVELDFQENAESLHITAIGRDRLVRNVDEFGFSLSVPEDFDLKLHTNGGAISITDLVASADAETSGGSIDMGDVGGDVHARTEGGTITVGDVGGNAVLYTAGGMISAGFVQGMLEADTVGGTITLERGGGPIDLHTAGGSITTGPVAGTIIADTSGGSISTQLAELPAGVSGEVSLETSGGDLEIRVPANHRATIEARIEVSRRARGDYHVYTDFPLTFRGEDISEVIASGAINGGGDSMRLRTRNGDIRIISVE